MSILRQILNESEYDFSHIPKSDERQQTDTTGINKSIRLLGIDKSKINQKLKEISNVPEQNSIPLSKIKEVLSEYDIEIVETTDTKFKGNSGDVSYNLIKHKQLIKNCNLIIYWKTIEDGLDLNIYLE